MTRCCCYTLLVFLLMWGNVSQCSSSAKQPPITHLVKDGRSHHVIVIQSDAAQADKTAAEELQRYIELISGARLPVVSEADYKSGPMVAVGFNSKLPDQLRQEHFGNLGEEEILILPSGDNLLLAGGSPRGTLYAVYEFLHQLGVRFYTPKFTKAPKNTAITMPKACRYNPPVRARSMTVGNGGGAEWVARNRLNSLSLWSSPGEKYGGGYAEGPDMHTIWRQMPLDVLREHPDWSAEVHGKRLAPAGNNSWGLCLNPQTRAYLVRRGVEYAKAHPEIHTIWTGINDGSPYCTCEYCKGFYKEHGGSPSSLVLQLVNELAQALSKECPGRMTKTIAYSWTTDPPTGMQARDDVTVMFCAPTDYLLPFAANPDTSKMRKAIAGWKKICRNMSIYLYAYPSDNYWFPTPSLYPFAENIKWAYSGGINDIYIQISGFRGSYGSESMDMRAWAYSRLMWNPKQDFRKLIAEFARDNYGPAAETVLEIIDQDYKNALDDKGRVKQFENGPLAPDYIDLVNIRDANLRLDKAHKSLKDEGQRKRLELFRIPYLWADVWCGFTRTQKYDAPSSMWSVPMTDGRLRNRYAKLCKQFMIDNGITGLTELVQANPRQLAIDKMGVNWKAYRLQDADSSVVVVPGVAGNLFDMRTSKTDFKPLKDAWMTTITRYPLASSWRDLVHGDYVDSYTVVSHTASSVTLENKSADRRVRKSVRVENGITSVDLEAVSIKNTPLKLETHMMFDMLPSAFGDAPEVYVEKKAGEWSKKMPGEGLGDFWYAYGSLDMLNATGRIVLASEARSEGVLVMLDPALLENINFEYDRYDHPNGFGHMFELIISTPSKAGAEDDPVRLNVKAQIVLNARVIVTR